MKQRDRQEVILQTFRKLIADHKRTAGPLSGDKMLVMHPDMRYELGRLTRKQRQSISYIPFYYDVTCPPGNIYIVDKSVVLANKPPVITKEMVRDLYRKATNS